MFLSSLFSSKPMLIADWEEFFSKKGGARTLLFPYSLKRGQKSRAAVYHFFNFRRRRTPQHTLKADRYILLFYLSESVDGGEGGREMHQVRKKKKSYPFARKNIYNNSSRRRRSQRRSLDENQVENGIEPSASSDEGRPSFWSLC